VSRSRNNGASRGGEEATTLASPVSGCGREEDASVGAVSCACIRRVGVNGTEGLLREQDCCCRKTRTARMSRVCRPHEEDEEEQTVRQLSRARVPALLSQSAARSHEVAFPHAGDQ
jgi:hypothetical protein